MTQIECPTGHAVLPVPFTEAQRAPSLEEICEVQLWGREIEKIAVKMHPHFDFSEPKKFAASICKKGRRIFNDALSYLEECGVDTKNAVEMLYVLKSLGPRVFEDTLNPSAKNGSAPAGESLAIPNDIFTKTLEQVDIWTPYFRSSEVKEKLTGRRVLLASTDVHEHGLLLIDKLLQQAGCLIVNIGAERNPDEVVLAGVQSDAEIIFISTHNGMALEYARNVLDEMEEQNVSIPICMGGVLNQNTEEGTLPIDVSSDLERLGIGTVSDLTLLPECAVSLLNFRQ
jgi:methylmalonyl-CoA mutase cobalamin-binding subunit